MRLCTFSAGSATSHVGVALSGDRVLDVTAAMASDPRYASLLSIMEHEAVALPAIRALMRDVAASPPSDRMPVFDLRSVTLHVPYRPPQIRCFSVYEQHLKNAFGQVLKNEIGFFARLLLDALGMAKIPKAFYAAPAYYKGVRMNLSGHLDAVSRPRPGGKLDYEAELGVVVGRRGKDIDKARAMSHVFGYVVFNDFSERDQLMKEMRSRPSPGPAKGKDFDGSNALGPWVVTADEVRDPHALDVSVRVNGQLRGQGSTALMTHRIDSIVSYASWNETLHPGELLATGCVPNCAGIEQWRFLQDGDRVDVDITGLGALSNTITAQ